APVDPGVSTEPARRLLRRRHVPAAGKPLDEAEKHGLGKERTAFPARSVQEAGRVGYGRSADTIGSRHGKTAGTREAGRVSWAILAGRRLEKTNPDPFLRRLLKKWRVWTIWMTRAHSRTCSSDLEAAGS